jgi:endoglucanase Acf2
MLSTEVRTARDYWVHPELPEGFDAPMVSLNWGGKRDYATFFDPSPAAILGIQLIPFGPTMEYLQAEPERIEALVEGALPGDSLEQPLADYLLMFLALADPDRALELARRLPDARIDNANSRSYLTASILAARSG